ncbi:hypothetical protein HMPREF1430_00751 [Helicobacter pylori GAM96Ai]|nr:hypothetical protein HMPREF1430_00751 [Helicobacter pylori GAM96Ai]
MFLACESSKISFASLTCEKFPCMRVFACLFFLFYFNSLWLLRFKLVCSRIFPLRFETL